MRTLKEDYELRFNEALTPLASKLENHIKEILKGEPRIDRISARPKAIKAFLKKSETKNDDGSSKYVMPLTDIQDQLGARIVTFYNSDVLRISGRIERFFTGIEARNRVPDRESEFGYFGRHYLFFVPTDIANGFEPNLMPKVFELQIKTLFQHAWSEANHDLGYKNESGTLSADDKRKIAFTSAQAWGADMIFDQLFSAND